MAINQVKFYLGSSERDIVVFKSERIIDSLINLAKQCYVRPYYGNIDAQNVYFGFIVEDPINVFVFSAETIINYHSKEYYNIKINSMEQNIPSLSATYPWKECLYTMLHLNITECTKNIEKVLTCKY